MTLQELDQEDQTLREVIHDLEKTIQSYRAWIDRNAIARHALLDAMASEAGC